MQGEVRANFVGMQLLPTLRGRSPHYRQKGGALQGASSDGLGGSTRLGQAQDPGPFQTVWLVPLHGCYSEKQRMGSSLSLESR